MNEKQKESSTLALQETRTTVYVFVGKSRSIHDSERHFPDMFFTMADLKLLCLVVCIVATLSESPILITATIADEKARQGVWRTYSAGKRADPFHRGYRVPDGFSDASKIPTEVLNLLKLPPSSSVEPLQMMIDLVMSNFFGKEVLKEKKNQNL